MKTRPDRWQKCFYGLLLLCALLCLLGSRGEVQAFSLFSLVPGEAALPLTGLLVPPQERDVPAFAPAEERISLVPQEETAPAPGSAPEEDDLAAIPTRTYQAAGRVNILLYHTHTTEAYRQDGEDTYAPSGESRTKDTRQNIVRVGEELKKHLEDCGFRVIHDTTDHEPPKLATSYSRSEATMKKYRAQYPDIDLYIDLHRDAADVEKQQNDVVKVDGERCARIMFVVGRGEKYEDKPDWQANYQLAKSICARLDAVNKRFTRKIRLKKGRYNQHIGKKCVLIEVGHNANTLQDALNAMPHLARAISQVLLPPLAQ